MPWRCGEGHTSHATSMQFWLTALLGAGAVLTGIGYGLYRLVDAGFPMPFLTPGGLRDEQEQQHERIYAKLEEIDETVEGVADRQEQLALVVVEVVDEMDGDPDVPAEVADLDRQESVFDDGPLYRGGDADD